MNRLATLCTLTALAALGAGMAQAQDLPVPGAQFMLQWDLDGDGKVTPAEAREQRQNIFYMFDQDSDGKFSKEEFAGIDEHKALEREAGKGPGSQRPATPGQGLGAGNGPGKGMGQGMGQGMGPGKGAGKGMGAGQGMGQGMGPGKGAGNGPGMGPGRGGLSGFDMPAEEGMRLFDANRDGTVTEAEFVDGSGLWFAQRDRNGDGVLTEDDFGPGR
ncbi:MAG: EF-hand domain-containing protein [Paracoccaceae bacterium]